MRTAVRVCLALLACALVALTATGAWLWFNYRPTAAQAWPTIRTAAHHSTWVRSAHRFSAYLAVVLALGCFVLLIGRRLRAGQRGVVAGLALVVTALAASFTGYLLPWDQLALWAVRVGTNIKGAQAIFDARIKYILIGSREVSVSAYRFWAIAHVVLGLLVAAAVVLAWLRARESRPAPDADAEPELVRSS